MIATIEPLNSGFALSDPADPRHQYITGLRRKFGQFLHEASASLQQQGEENTVDAVHGLVSYILRPRRNVLSRGFKAAVNPHVLARVRRQQGQVSRRISHF